MNGKTGPKGMTFERDFHLLVSSHYLLVNGGTGKKVVLLARFSFTCILTLFTSKWWNWRKTCDLSVRFSCTKYLDTTSKWWNGQKSRDFLARFSFITK